MHPRSTRPTPRPLTLALASTFALAALTPAPGCSREDERPRVIHFTPPDVAQRRDTYRHRESGLIFTTPGPDWRQLPELAAARLDPTALVAFESTDHSCRAWATLSQLAEAPPPRDPYDASPPTDDAAPTAPDLARAAADLARTTTLDTLEGPSTHVDEYVLFDLWTARRWELQGRRDGVLTSIRATFFVDKDRLYRIQAEASGPLYGERRRCLDLVTGGFTFARPAAASNPEAPAPAPAPGR